MFLNVDTLYISFFIYFGCYKSPQNISKAANYINYMQFGQSIGEIEFYVTYSRSPIAQQRNDDTPLFLLFAFLYLQLYFYQTMAFNSLRPWVTYFRNNVNAPGERMHFLRK